MAWYVISGRNVSFQIGKWSSTFYQDVPVIQDVISGGGVPTGVTILPNPCFLNDVGIELSAGITPIVAIGVENIAALEEFIVRAQNIRTRFTIQTLAAGQTVGPIDFVHSLISGSTRLLESDTPPFPHLNPYFLDFYVVDPAVGTPGILNAWRVCAPFAFIRNLRWIQRPEDAAQLEITWFVPYISFQPVTTVVPVTYTLDAGILISREATLSVEATGSDVIDLSRLTSDRIISDLTIEINNDLREVYTFSLPTDITTGSIRRLLRVFNAIFEGRSTITGNFTMIYPAMLGSLNLAQPQAYKTMTITYYEAAGSGYTATPRSVYSITLHDVKILDSRVTFAQEQMVTLAATFQALDITCERPS